MDGLFSSGCCGDSEHCERPKSQCLFSGPLNERQQLLKILNDAKEYVNQNDPRCHYIIGLQSYPFVPTIATLRLNGATVFQRVYRYDKAMEGFFSDGKNFEDYFSTEITPCWERQFLHWTLVNISTLYLGIKKYGRPECEARPLPTCEEAKQGALLFDEEGALPYIEKNKWQFGQWIVGTFIRSLKNAIPYSSEESMNGFNPPDPKKRLYKINYRSPNGIVQKWPYPVSDRQYSIVDSTGQSVAADLRLVETKSKAREKNRIELEEIKEKNDGYFVSYIGNGGTATRCGHGHACDHNWYSASPIQSIKTQVEDTGIKAIYTDAWGGTYIRVYTFKTRVQFKAAMSLPENRIKRDRGIFRLGQLAWSIAIYDKRGKIEQRTKPWTQSYFKTTQPGYRLPRTCWDFFTYSRIRFDDPPGEIFSPSKQTYSSTGIQESNYAGDTLYLLSHGYTANLCGATVPCATVDLNLTGQVILNSTRRYGNTGPGASIIYQTVVPQTEKDWSTWAQTFVKNEINLRTNFCCVYDMIYESGHNGNQ